MYSLAPALGAKGPLVLDPGFAEQGVPFSTPLMVLWRAQGAMAICTDAGNYPRESAKHFMTRGITAKYRAKLAQCNLSLVLGGTDSPNDMSPTEGAKEAPQTAQASLFLHL